MEGALLLDVVVAQGPAILQLLAGEDKTLLIGRNTWKTGIVKKCISNLFSNRKFLVLLNDKNIDCLPTFLVLDLGFYILDRVGGLNLEGYGLTREGLDEYLHR